MHKQKQESGLVINPLLPYVHIAATPDEIVQCTCCGMGVVEAKCPYKCRAVSFKEACNDPSFFLCCNPTESNHFSLRSKHAYYYQVQLQIKLCEVD